MKISVYITSYNNIEYLEQAIDSVINQSLMPFEVIIVDDYSHDDSRSLILSYANKYPELIKPIFNEKNLGIPLTRNVALKAVTGDLITSLDGDDYYYSKKLENELLWLNNSVGCYSVYSNFHYVSESNQIQGRFSKVGDNPAQGDIFPNVFGRNYGVTSGGNIRCDMFYKKCLEDVGYYNPEVSLWEDWDFYIRFSKRYQYAYCPEINMVYRQHDMGLSKVTNELHYRYQKKIFNNNKSLLNNINEEKKLYIKSRVNKKLEGLLNGIMEDSINAGNLLKAFYVWTKLFISYKKKEYCKICLRYIIPKWLFNNLLISYRILIKKVK